MFFGLHLHAPVFEAAYLMPLGVPVQNIVGPLSPSKAVQVQCGTMLVFVCEVKQYLQASTLSSKGPNDMLLSPDVSTATLVVFNFRSPATGATRSAMRTMDKRAMLSDWVGR